MQRLLSGYVWDADLVRDDLNQYVIEQLGDADSDAARDISPNPPKGWRQCSRKGDDRDGRGNEWGHLAMD